MNQTGAEAIGSRVIFLTGATSNINVLFCSILAIGKISLWTKIYKSKIHLLFLVLLHLYETLSTMSTFNYFLAFPCPLSVFAGEKSPRGRHRNKLSYPFLSTQYNWGKGRKVFVIHVVQKYYSAGHILVWFFCENSFDFSV
jgi:hypothetical protein